MLLVTEIEDADGSIGGNRGEDADLAPGDVVDLLIMSNKLCLDGAALDIPDSTGGVDRAGANAAGFGIIPIERGKRSRVLSRLTVVKDGAELGRGGGVRREVPEAEEVAGGGKERRRGFGVEKQLGSRVRVVEGERGEGTEGERVFIEDKHVDAVVWVLDEGAKGESW